MQLGNEPKRTLEGSMENVVRCGKACAAVERLLMVGRMPGHPVYIIILRSPYGQIIEIDEWVDSVFTGTVYPEEA